MIGGTRGTRQMSGVCPVCPRFAHPAGPTEPTARKGLAALIASLDPDDGRSELLSQTMRRSVFPPGRSCAPKHSP